MRITEISEHICFLVLTADAHNHVHVGRVKCKNRFMLVAEFNFMKICLILTDDTADESGISIKVLVVVM